MNYSLSSDIKLKTSQDQGFSLVEVLISILMIAGFLATAMQALVAATAIKVKSEEISEATNWMQEDLEALRFEANRLDNVSGVFSPDAAVCSSGYATRLRTEINNASATYASNNQNKTNALGGRQYRLKRMFPSPDRHILKIEYTVVRLNSSGAEEGDPIGSLYSEIIPDVALACPLG